MQGNSTSTQPILRSSKQASQMFNLRSSGPPPILLRPYTLRPQILPRRLSQVVVVVPTPQAFAVYRRPSVESLRHR